MQVPAKAILSLVLLCNAGVVAAGEVMLFEHPEFRGRTLTLRGTAPNIGIVTSYNDMLSAHQPYEHYPDIIKDAARRIGATAQVAGGVPAMCDGVTQGQPGMDLSLFSRDVIAMATAFMLSSAALDSSPVSTPEAAENQTRARARSSGPPSPLVYMVARLNCA